MCSIDGIPQSGSVVTQPFCCCALLHLIFTMNLVILLIIAASTLTPSLLPGLKAKEIADSEQLTAGILYGDLLEGLNGAHLRIAATHV